MRVSGKSIGVGVIGLGFMGRTHLAAYAASQLAQVRAVFDPVRRAAPVGNLITGADGVEALLAATPHEASVDALLARRDIELVSICTPTDSHVVLARKAIAARKHVLIEKPTSLDAREIDDLADAAERAGVLAMPAHCMRFWPAWAWMADAVRSRRFGKPLRASFTRLGARPAWSQDFYLDISRSGGALVDLHIHDADFVRFAFGEPEAVSARGSRMHVRSEYRYACGLVVEAEGGWSDNPDFAFRMEARIELEHGVLDFVLGREPELTISARAVEPGVEYPHGSGYEHQISALLGAIARGALVAPVSLRDAAATQRLLDRESGSPAFNST